jgi:hypothetical protein
MSHIDQFAEWLFNNQEAEKKNPFVGPVKFLRDYQEDISKKGMDILRKYGILYLAMEVRTGKTLTALATAERGGYRNVLFVSKKKAIPSIEADREKMSAKMNLMVVNFERVEKLTVGGFDLIIIDEAHGTGAFPKPSKRTLALRKICAGKDVIFLSGTPSPESYAQLYHQLSISGRSPFAAYTNFYKWANAFVTIRRKRIGGGQMVNDYSQANGDLIWKHIKHLFIRFTQEEAGFVAPVDEIILEVEMAEDSKRIYRDLERHKLHTRSIPHSGREINATVNSGADLINKLSQISGGTLLFDDQPNGVIIDWSKATFIVSYFIGKKIAIFYRYKAELELLKAFFPNWTDSPELFNASSTLTFLGQIQAAREGVNLATADALVMYNIDFSATSYFQARARIQSKERQGSAPLYWIFSKHGVERKIYQAVTNKTNFTYSYYRTHYVGKTNTSQNKEGANQTRLDSPATHTSQHIGVS